MAAHGENKHFFVYMLRCSDGTLYTGITTDPVRRLEEHNSGTGARFTRARLPVIMVYAEKADRRSEASKREAEIKRYPREKKLLLIESEQNVIGEIKWIPE